MRISDVMTRDVITVAPDTAIHAAAQLMVDHTVSGLPVIDEAGALVGILSDGDLIPRHLRRSRPPWWQLLFANGERLASEYQKAVGVTVAELMTPSVVCVSPDDPLSTAAELLTAHGFRRLPVVVAGALVGIVSRADLVKGVIGMARGNHRAVVSDAELVSEMTRRMSEEPWTSPRTIEITADHGVLTLRGFVTGAHERSALSTMARAIPGCRGVDVHLLARSEVLTRHSGI